MLPLKTMVGKMNPNRYLTYVLGYYYCYFDLTTTVHPTLHLWRSFSHTPHSWIINASFVFSTVLFLWAHPLLHIKTFTANPVPGYPCIFSSISLPFGFHLLVLIYSIGCIPLLNHQRQESVLFFKTNDYSLLCNHLLNFSVSGHQSGTFWYPQIAQDHLYSFVLHCVTYFKNS